MRWYASAAGRLDELAFLLIGFYAAMTYSRFLFLAAIVLTPILAKELDFLPPYQPAIDKAWLNAVLIARDHLAGAPGAFPRATFCCGIRCETIP